MACNMASCSLMGSTFIFITPVYVYTRPDFFSGRAFLSEWQFLICHGRVVLKCQGIRRDAWQNGRRQILSRFGYNQLFVIFCYGLVQEDVPDFPGAVALSSHTFMRSFRRLADQTGIHQFLQARAEGLRTSLSFELLLPANPLTQLRLRHNAVKLIAQLDEYALQ